MIVRIMILHILFENVAFLCYTYCVYHIMPYQYNFPKEFFMKTIFPIFILTLLLLSPAFSDLDVPDLEKIDGKIRESNKDLKDSMNGRFDSIDKQLDRNFELIDGRFNSIEKQLGRNHNLSLAILALTGSLVIGLIGTVIWYVRKGESFIEDANKLSESSKELIGNIERVLRGNEEHIEFTNQHIADIKEAFDEVDNIRKLYLDELERMKSL